MLVFPLARLMFGTVDAADPPAWTERIAAALELLPKLYGVTLVAGLFLVLGEMARARPTASDALGWMLSLWATLVFATCVAHELLHRSNQYDRMLGHVLAGAAGYPLLGYEHRRHHSLAGSTADAEWPRVTETVWNFAWRRLCTVSRECLAPRGPAAVGSFRAPAVVGLRVGLVASASSLAMFALAAGWTGAVIYAAASSLVAFSVQLVTYLQHWGLGDDNLPDARVGDYGWEGDCQFQAWVTLGLSLHQAHHRGGTRPYYQLALSADSPRAPAGYVILMFAALVPSVWRRVMGPALSHWRAHPRQPLSSGRRLACVSYYR